MLMQFAEDIMINTAQIVSITRSNVPERAALMSMSNGETFTLDYEPKDLADKIVKAEAAADTYYFV